MIRNRTDLARTDRDETALACVEAGIEAARPDRVLAEAVTLEGDALIVDGTAYDLAEYEEVVVVGGGKAGGTMAAALESILGDRIDRGVVVTSDPVETDRIEVLEGAHPTPDEGGVAGTRRVLELAEEAGPETLLLTLVSGGGSALLTAPASPVTLADLQSTTEALLASGATIHEINAVRKHLSESKGGRLAATAAPATVVGLVVSDVVGNDLDVIASGPLVGDDTTYADALTVLESYDLEVSEPVRTRLERGASGDAPETPTPGNPAFDRVDVHLLADGTTALEAAAAVADERGYEPLLLSSRIRGEAREAALTQVAVAEEVRATGTPLSPPAAVLSGGETTVTIRGDGRGGPNQEFALSAAIELEDPGVSVASVDTDGIDGASDVAGALVDGGTVADEGAAREALSENDALPFLEAREAIVETGPTGTNVNDLRVILIDE